MIENAECRESADREAARLTTRKKADEPVTGTMTKASPEEALSPNGEEMLSQGCSWFDPGCLNKHHGCGCALEYLQSLRRSHF
jgi:hypothetical protein